MQGVEISPPEFFGLKSVDLRVGDGCAGTLVCGNVAYLWRIWPDDTKLRWQMRAVCVIDHEIM